MKEWFNQGSSSPFTGNRVRIWKPRKTIITIIIKIKQWNVQKTSTYCAVNSITHHFRIILDLSADGFVNMLVSSWKLFAGVTKIWLFEPPTHVLLSNQNCLLLSYFLRPEVSCSSGIRTEETEPLKNSQVTMQGSCSSCWENKRSLISLTWNLHILDSWLNIYVDYLIHEAVSKTRMAC